MSFNYASEKRKFDAMWAKLRVEYCEAEMEESAIAAIYEFDCEVFQKTCGLQCGERYAYGRSGWKRSEYRDALVCIESGNGRSCSSLLY